MALDSILKLEKLQRESEVFVDKYFPIHTQIMIDDSLFNIFQRKPSMLKTLNEFMKLKFKTLEDKLKSEKVASIADK